MSAWSSVPGAAVSITGQSVWQSWQDERVLLTPLPELLPEPFDVVHTRQVGLDGLVSFEARQYSCPCLHWPHVEVRAVPVVSRFSPTMPSSPSIHATAPSGYFLTSALRGAATDRIMPPPPLGRMGRKLQELAQEPVLHRSIICMPADGGRPMSAPRQKLDIDRTRERLAQLGCCMREQLDTLLGRP